VRRPRRRPPSERAAGRALAREIALAQRWDVIARHALLTRDTARVLLCQLRTPEEKAAYPSRAAAEQAHRDLMNIGAHTRPTLAYECPLPVPGRTAPHWHLTSRTTGKAAS
jgi:hypothetical protein